MSTDFSEECQAPVQMDLSTELPKVKRIIKLLGSKPISEWNFSVSTEFTSLESAPVNLKDYQIPGTLVIHHKQVEYAFSKTYLRNPHIFDYGLEMRIRQGIESTRSVVFIEPRIEVPDYWEHGKHTNLQHTHLARFYERIRAEQIEHQTEEGENQAREVLDEIICRLG